MQIIATTIKNNLLNYTGIDHMELVKKGLNLSDEFIKAVIEKSFKEAQTMGDYKVALAINKQLKLSDEFLNSEGILKGTKVAFVKALYSNDDFKEAIRIKKEFNLPEDFIHSDRIHLIIKDAIQNAIVQKDTGNYSKLKTELSLTDDLVNEAAINALKESLENGNYQKSTNIKGEFNLSKDIIESSQIKKAAESCFISLLRDKKDYNLALKFMKEFDLSKDILKLEQVTQCLESLIVYFLGLKKYSKVEELKSYFNFKPSKALEMTLDIFGNFSDIPMYENVRHFLDAKESEDIPVDFKKMAIKNTGERGIMELRQAITNMKLTFREPTYHETDLLDNPMKMSFFKNYIGLKESHYGTINEGSFNKNISAHMKFYKDGLIEDLPPAYEPSHILSINKLDREKQLDYQFTEDFNEKFKILRQSILDAYNFSESSGELKDIVNELLIKKEDVLKEMEIKLEKLKTQEKANPKAIEHLSKRLDLLKTVNIPKRKNYEKYFTILASFKEFDGILRKLIFFMAFHRFKEQKLLVLDNLTNETPTLDNLSWTLEFIDHITNKETKKYYFQDDAAKQAFIKLTNAKALSNAHNDITNLDSKGKMKLQFIPTRGLLMEFSGHIADACWAGKEDSIAKNHPNMSSLIMVQNPDSPHERLAGACMLIETESSSGEPLLIIRGLNPIENVITQLSVDSFYKNVTQYLKKIAKESNRKLMIVIDDHCGGSASNRPSVYDYLTKKCKTKRVQLASDKDTRFNNYPITNICYEVV